jgi:hypothetical protein
MLNSTNQPQREPAVWELILTQKLEEVSQTLWKDTNKRKSNKEWTTTFKKVFHDLRPHGHICRSSKNAGEFLWDISWIKTDDDFRKNKFELFLPCEIEWNGDDATLTDFKKLLVSKAEYLVMVFDMEWNKKKKENRFEEKVKQMLDMTVLSEGQKLLLLGVKSIYDKPNDNIVHPFAPLFQ